MAKASVEQVLAAIAGNPGCSNRFVALQVGVTPASAGARLARLRRQGLVKRRVQGRRCVNVLTPAGHERLRQPARLSLPAPERILQAVRLHPGLGVRGLARASGLSVMTVRAHLPGLLASGLVELRIETAQHRYVLAGHDFQPPLDAGLAAVLEAIGTGASQRQVLRALRRVSRSTVQARLAKLEALGKIKAEGQERGAVYRPTGT